MNFRTYALPVVAVLGMVAAVYTVRTSDRDLAAAPPIAPPSPSPFQRQIAGAGIVEARSENVAVGTPVSGLIVGVAVSEGAWWWVWRGGGGAMGGGIVWVPSARGGGGKEVMTEGMPLIGSWETESRWTSEVCG